MATEFLFTGNDILSFRFFWKALLQQKGSHYFIKKICNCRRNRFLQLFFQILTRMKVAFRFSEIAFFKESFILASRNGFSINYKLCAFIWNFFLLVDAMLEIRCKPVFFNFFYSYQRKQFFWLVETDFLSNASFRLVETDFLLSLLLLRPNVVLVKTIIQIKVRSFFIE